MHNKCMGLYGNLSNISTITNRFMASVSKQWYDVFHSSNNSAVEKGDEQWRICVTRGVKMHLAINIIQEIPCGLTHSVQTPNLDRPKLTKVRLLIQTSNLIRRTQFSLNQNWSKLLVKKPKTETACKIRYNNLCIRFGTWKVRRLNQSRSKGGIPGWSRREERLSRSKFK